MKAEEYRNILSKAIDREVESYSFYRTVSERVKDQNLKKLFNELAGEETKHREFLQGLLAKEPRQLAFLETKDYKVVETVGEPRLSPDMKPLDGLVLAMKKELDAMQMYNQLASASSDPEQKRMFQELVKMERGHKNHLEDIYTDMAYPEVW